MVESGRTLMVDNPNKVVIEIESTAGFVEIDVTQSFNYRLEENKKPIYGYNQRHFSKVLAGKAIASGTLVIKKHAKESIIASLNLKRTESLRKTIADKLANKLDVIYELLTSETATVDYVQNSAIITEETIRRDGGYLNKQLTKFSEDALEEQIAVRLAENRAKDSSVYTFDNLLKRSNINIRVHFGQPFLAAAFEAADSVQETVVETANGYYLNFRNVSFVAKEANITVGELTIDEVYSFIGNLE